MSETTPIPPVMPEKPRLNAWSAVNTPDVRARILPRPMNGTALVKLYHNEIDVAEHAEDAMSDCVVIKMDEADTQEWWGNIEPENVVRYAIEARNLAVTIKRLRK